MLTLQTELTPAYHEAKRITMRRFVTWTGRAVETAIDEAAERARTQHKHKRRTGRLTSPDELFGYVERVTDKEAFGFLENHAPYAGHVEYGTRPHLILPLDYHWGSRRAQRPTSRVTGKRVSGVSAGAGRGMALRFTVGGRVVFRRSVRHPGTRPMPFMRPAAEYAAVVIARETEHVTFPALAAIWS